MKNTIIVFALATLAGCSTYYPEKAGKTFYDQYYRLHYYTGWCDPIFGCSVKEVPIPVWKSRYVTPEMLERGVE